MSGEKYKNPNAVSASIIVRGVRRNQVNALKVSRHVLTWKPRKRKDRICTNKTLRHAFYRIERDCILCGWPDIIFSLSFTWFCNGSSIWQTTTMAPAEVATSLEQHTTPWKYLHLQFHPSLLLLSSSLSSLSPSSMRLFWPLNAILHGDGCIRTREKSCNLFFSVEFVLFHLYVQFHYCYSYNCCCWSFLFYCIFFFPFKLRVSKHFSVSSVEIS